MKIMMSKYALFAFLSILTQMCSTGNVGGMIRDTEMKMEVERGLNLSLKGGL